MSGREKSNIGVPAAAATVTRDVSVDQTNETFDTCNTATGTISSDAHVRSESGTDEKVCSSTNGGGRIARSPERWKTWDWERTANFLRSARRPEALASIALFDAIDECAPEEFIRNLIGTYPGTLRDGVESGNLPLHVILRRSASGGTGGPWSSSLINFFIRKNPAALDVADLRGAMPLNIWMGAWQNRFDYGTARKFREVVENMLDIKPEVTLETYWSRHLDSSRPSNLSLLELLEWDWLGDSAMADDEDEDARGTHWDVLIMVLRATWRAEEMLRGRDIDTDADFLPIHSYIRLEKRNCPILSSIPSCPTPGSNKIRSEIQNAIHRGDYRDYIDSFRRYKASLGVFFSVQSSRLVYKVGRYHVLAEIIKRHSHQVRTTDADGNFPLHLVAQQTQITSNIIDLLVKVDSLAASTPDCRGRLPLHLAVEAGRTWEDGLDVLLDASPRAVEILDPTTFLYPFMAAAVGESSSIDTVFRLLQRNPDLVLGLSCVQLTRRPNKRRRLG
mmetsp:Transcript_21638/g.63542  ORF Transcript_21638/g.63542 Transcript_21638/m.63542 type:complete len:505 (-) Transcript_21638:1450-2964(-)